jgi:hypothetical protein
MKIWKYVFDGLGETSWLMPKGARCLAVQPQGGAICVWMLVDPNVTHVERRTFDIVVTPFDTSRYIGTVQIGAFVWHVFEVTK